MMIDWKAEIRDQLTELQLSPVREAEIVEELSQHLEDRFQELLTDGESPEEARRAVLAEVADSHAFARELRRVEQRTAPEPLALGARGRGYMIVDFWQDLRYAARLLRKSPGFTAVAVLTLALGIGANSAIFSLVDTVLLKSLPVDRPEELVFIENVGLKGGGGAPAYPCFERLRDHTEHLSALAAFCSEDLKINLDGQIEQAKGQYVSGSYFSLLGVKPVVGRVFTPADDAVIGSGGGDGAVAVLGYDYWQRRFARRPDVIGKVIEIGKRPVTIVGVTPANFFGLEPGQNVDVNLPMMLADAGLLTARNANWYEAIGRLAPGSSAEQARSELDAVFQTYMDETGGSRSLREDFFDHIQLRAAGQGVASLRTPYTKPLLILMAIVVLVLLVACANVANLLLARAAARRREFAVRLALGASRSRVLRQLLTECLLLVGSGGLLGLLVARWGSATLVAYFSTGRRPMFLHLELDGHLLLFTLAVSLLTGIIFSLVLTWRVSRLNPGVALKEHATTASSDPLRVRLGNLLVVAQVAMSLLLLVGAGLFLRTLQNWQTLDAGFQPEGVLTMRIDVAAREYQRPQLDTFWKEVLTRIQALPGARATSLSVLSPVDGRDRGVMIEVPGFTPRAERDKAVSLNSVSPYYFAAMQIDLQQGRLFTERDNEAAPKVGLLNETAARFFFGDRNPIGEQIRVSRPRYQPPIEIVGIVRDSKHMSLQKEIPPLLYLPLLQAIDSPRLLTLAVRSDDNLAALAHPVRNELYAMGAGILVTHVATLSDQINQSLLRERLLSSLSSLFALVTLLLACLGLYGVISYTVARRTSEIGVRLALGATPGAILCMVLRESLGLVIAGIVIGVPLSLAVTRLVATLLYGVSAADPMTMIAAILLLLTVAGCSALLPARRATKVDPLVALRYE